MRSGNRPSLWPKAQALPGFYLSGGVTILWISLIVLLPLAALVFRPWQEGVSAMSHVLSDTRMYAALRVSFGCALIAVIIDMVIGLLLVWTLIRLTPPGARAINLLIDLPFAIPTAVTGITLATLYGQNGWIGSVFYKLGIKIAFTPGGIVAALVFVGLPFVVRTVEPVLRSFPKDIEEAAQLLGATRFQRSYRVIFPGLAPALISGAGLAFARCVGEYGSVIFIAGNQPYHSEVAPLLIVMRLQEFNYAAATSIAVILLAISLLCLAGVGQLRRLSLLGMTAGSEG